MNTKKRTRVIVAGMAVTAVAACGAVGLTKGGDVKVREVRGTVTHIDVDARQASMEAVNPRSGAIEDINGEVPEDCRITINGEAAKLIDLRVGDQVLAKGRGVRDGRSANGRKRRRVTADWVEVTR